MEIEICVGSSCHLKGSYQVIRALEDYIEKNRLQDVLRLKGSFCLGECTRGVSVRVRGEVFSMNEENCTRVLKDIMEVEYAAD